MGKETRHPSTPRKAPYQAPLQAAASVDLLGSTLNLPPTPPHAQHHQYARSSQDVTYPQQQYLDLPASPAHSSGTSHSARSSPPRVTPGSSPGQMGQGSTTGPTDSSIDPKLFKLLEHGVVARTFGSKLAKAFFGEVFAVTVNHKDRAAAEYRDTDTAHYRHIDRAFTRMALWKADSPAVTRAVVDYAANDGCGTIVKYNSEGANWRPPRWFTDRKPGLHWFQGPMGGAGIDLNKCETPELAAQYLRVPEGQAVLCNLSKFSTCHLRIKWIGFPDKTFEVKTMNPYTPRELYLHELAALVGSQVLRYFREVAINVPRLNPLKDVIVLGLIHLKENEWTVMLQHCPPELRILPPPGWQGAPQGYAQGAPSPPVWTTPSPPQAWNADVASIASGSSGSGLSATTTLAGAANAGKKHKYAGSVASGYAPSYSSASPQSQYPEYDDASTIGGKYNYPL